MSPFTITKRRDIIPQTPGRYLSFPGMAVASNGDIVLGYRDARAVPDTFSHGEAGDIKIIRCSNGQWSSPQLLYNHTQSLEEMGCGDLTCLSDGTITLLSRQWDAANHRSAGVYIALSNDHGCTFTPRQPIDLSVFPNGWAPYGKIIELPGDTWLLGAYGVRENEQGFSAGCFESKDRGQTWQRRSWIATCGCIEGDIFHKRGFPEPFMLQLPDGSLYTLLRTNGTFYQTRSRDLGKTWQLPEPTFQGMAAAGLVLSSGELLITCRGIHESLKPHERPPAVACRKGRLYCCRLSPDGGQSWSIEQPIDEGEAWQVGSFGMGDVIERPDGSLLVVYYTSDKNQNPWIQCCELSRNQ